MGFDDVDDMPLPHLVVLGFGDRYLRVILIISPRNPLVSGKIQLPLLFTN